MSLKYLYEFTYKNNIYRFCSGNKDTVIDNVKYSATYISHSRIVYSVDQTLNEASIYTDIDNIIVQLFMSFIPTSPVELNIRRLKNGNVSKPFFWGTAVSVDITNDYEAEIKIKYFTATLEKVVNRWTYQSNCNHFVYSEDCGVNPANFSFLTVVTAVSEDGTEVTVRDIAKNGISDQEWLISGKIIIEATGSSSKIVDVKYAENKIILLSYFNISIGDEVRLYAGCNKTREHCLLKFNNLNRQSSKNYVPGRNPTEGI